LHIYQFTWSMADALDTTLANASMPNISYDQILGVPELSIGISYQRFQDENVIFSATIRKLADLIQFAEVRIEDVICDGTNTFMTVKSTFIEPFILKSEDNDELRLTINDNLSGLLWLRAAIGTKEETRG